MHFDVSQIEAELFCKTRCCYGLLLLLLDPAIRLTTSDESLPIPKNPKVICFDLSFQIAIMLDENSLVVLGKVSVHNDVCAISFVCDYDALSYKYTYIFWTYLFVCSFSFPLHSFQYIQTLKKRLTQWSIKLTTNYLIPYERYIIISMSGRNKRMDPYLDSPSSLLKAAQTVLDSQSSRHHP